MNWLQFWIFINELVHMKRQKWREIFASLSGILLILSKYVCIVCLTKAVFTCYAKLCFGYFTLCVFHIMYRLFNVFGCYWISVFRTKFSMSNVNRLSTDWILQQTYKYTDTFYRYLFVYVTMYKLCSHSVSSNSTEASFIQLLNCQQCQL